MVVINERETMTNRTSSEIAEGDSIVGNHFSRPREHDLDQQDSSAIIKRWKNWDFYELKSAGVDKTINHVSVNSLNSIGSAALPNLPRYIMHAASYIV